VDKQIILTQWLGRGPKIKGGWEGLETPKEDVGIGLGVIGRIW